MNLGRIGIAVWAGVALASCGGNPSTADAGARVDSGSLDAGVPDAGPPDLGPPIAAWEETTEEFVPTTLDYSCLGTWTRPVPGDPVSTSFELRDFQKDYAVDATDVWLFTNNEIADDCSGANCQAFTTDRDGNATVTMPAGGWYAYRVLPHDGLSLLTTVFAVFQYNEPAPPAALGTVTGNSVSGSTINLIPALLGISRTDELAIVAGRIEDCAGGFVQNATIRMYDPDGVEVQVGELNDDPQFHYFNGDATNNLPDQMRERSNSDGLYVLVQIAVDPADARPYRVEAWGNLDGELTQIGCESARIFPDAVTILNMTPRREDAPAGCQ